MTRENHTTATIGTPSPVPCSIADAIERYGRMLTVREFAQLVAESPKTSYFEPLRHTHSTFRAMTERLDMDDNQMGFQRESQPEKADQALMAAHNCLLAGLEVQKERFNIPGLEEALQRSIRDWALVWSPESLAPAQPETTESSPPE